MARVLVVFAHPAFQKSKINKALLSSVQGLEHVSLHDLYEAYPDFHINEKQEQALLLQHDLIVLQHPFYWYSCPALLKEWLDLVLVSGFAYGQGGTQLRGKRLLSAITTGGSEASYRRQGAPEVTRDKLLYYLERTARLCGMTYLPPFVVYGTHDMQTAAAEKHGQDYRQVLAGLAADRFSAQQLDPLERLNQNVDTLLKG